LKDISFKLDRCPLKINGVDINGVDIRSLYPSNYKVYTFLLCCMRLMCHFLSLNSWFTVGFKPIFIQEANGHADGIWILSNRADLSFQFVDTHPQIITFSVSKLQQIWFCSGIYASPNPILHACFRDHLVSLRSRMNEPWLIAGDMNEILQPSEVAGGNVLLARSNIFRDVVDSCNFIDMPTVGGPLT